MKKFLILFVITFGLISSPISMCLGQQPGEEEGTENLAGDLGVEVLALRLSAEGALLDFRYKAIDPEKAQILFSREIKPYLVHEKSGKAVAVPSPPKIGPLRQTTNKPVAGKHYFMLFGNPGKFIQRGDRVTLVHGEHRIEGLVVE